MQCWQCPLSFGSHPWAPPGSPLLTLEPLLELLHMGVDLLVALALAPLPTEVMQLLVKVVQLTLQSLTLSPGTMAAMDRHR